MGCDLRLRPEPVSPQAPRLAWGSQPPPFQGCFFPRLFSVIEPPRGDGPHPEGPVCPKLLALGGAHVTFLSDLMGAVARRGSALTELPLCREGAEWCHRAASLDGAAGGKAQLSQTAGTRPGACSACQDSSIGLCPPVGAPVSRRNPFRCG